MSDQSRVLDDSRPIHRGPARLKAGGRRRFSQRPTLEALEGRALLSTVGSPDFTYGITSSTVTTGGPEMDTQGLAEVLYEPVGTFAANGNITNGEAIQSDGEVVTVGYSEDPQLNFKIGVARLNTDGTPDATFGNGGLLTIAGPTGVTMAEGEAVAIQPNGQIVVAADLYSNSFVNEVAVYRLNTDGSLDTTFGTGGSVDFQFEQGTTALPSSATALAIGANGDIVVGGYGNAGANGYLPALAQILPDGTLDPSFGTGGTVQPTFANSSAPPSSIDGSLVGVNGVGVLADGSILFDTTVAPPTYAGNFVGSIAVGKLTPTGSFDTTFGTAGQVLLGTADGAGPLAVLANGQLIVTGQDHAVTNTEVSTVHPDVYRLNTDGSLDTTFGTMGEATPLTLTYALNEGFGFDQVSAVLVQPDGTIFLGGLFTPDDDLAGVLALNSDGSLDTDFGTNGEAYLPRYEGPAADVNSLQVQANGQLLVGIPQGVARLLAIGATNDFDEDGTSDAAIFLEDYDAPVFAYGPSSGGANVFEAFGIPGAGQSLPAPGAYDGSGIDELAAYFPSIGAFGIRPYGTSGAQDEIDYIGITGAGNSLPAPANYTGAGYTELGVYEPSIGAFVYSTVPASNVAGVDAGANNVTIPFGTPGAGNSIPVPADYTGAGVDELGVYLPALGAFAYRPAGTTGADDVIIPFGTPGADMSIPVPGDYDGSGHTELAVYLPAIGAFAYRPYGTTGADDVIIPFGTPGLGNSIPMPGDYDGSGHTELAVYLPALGVLAYRPFDGGPDQYIPFGTPGAANSMAFSTVESDNADISGGGGGNAAPRAAAAGWVDFVADLASQTKKKGDSGSSAQGQS
jgi:uncharacterized delta-60 repeat protein